MTLAQTLIADPTFPLMSRAEKIDEAMALMRSADPDTEPDDLDAALAVEEAEALLEAGLPATDAPSPLATGLEPCREDRASCGSPVAGNGRCLECGARRSADAPATVAFVQPILARTQEIMASKPAEPVLARFKAATGQSDKALADLLNMARSTVQATASGRMAEKLTPSQLLALASIARDQANALADLAREIEDRAT